MVLVERSRALRASQQPGKPKPPGNPPNRREPDKTPPVEEPAPPIPAPAPDDERCRQRAVKAPSCAALPPILPVSSQAYS